VQFVVGLLMVAVGGALLKDLWRVRTRLLRAVMHGRGLPGRLLGTGSEADLRSQRALLRACSAFLLVVGALLMWGALVR
jgi:hypothetical protein